MSSVETEFLRALSHPSCALSSAPASPTARFFAASTRAQSFVFTFPDHDGSVAAAAAILPRAAAASATDLESSGADSSDQKKHCGTGGAGCRYPVLLALSGVGVKVRSQADSHKFKTSPSDRSYSFGFPDAWILSPQRGKRFSRRMSGGFSRVEGGRIATGKKVEEDGD